MLSLQTAGIHSEHLANIYGIKYLLIAGRSKLWDTEILQKQLPQYSFQCTRRVIKAQAVIYHLKAGSRGIKHREKYLQRSRILLSVPNRKVGALLEHPVCNASGSCWSQTRRTQLPSGYNRSQAQQKERKTFINNYLCNCKSSICTSSPGP